MKTDAKQNKEKLLEGKRVAILVENGFEEDELTSPRQALEQAGAKTDIVSPVKDKVKAWKYVNWGTEMKVDVPLDGADPEEYDALLLPGGVMNPDKLRRNEKALKFVKSFFEAGKPVGSICHGPWTLIDAGVVRGRTLTSYESIQTDLKNAGARWEDKEVIVDDGLVTSRKPDDLPAFNRKLIEEFAEGKHEPKAAGTMKLTSAAFTEGGKIPDEYTMYGDNRIPPIRIEDVPQNARSLALIVEDPDAPRGTFTHWVLFNVEPRFRDIGDNNIPAGSIQGTNDFGKTEYGGPKPPSGEHRYFFKAFALDAPISLPRGAKRPEVEAAMKDHVVARATLMGKYAHQ